MTSGLAWALWKAPCGKPFWMWTFRRSSVVGRRLGRPSGAPPGGKMQKGRETTTVAPCAEPPLVKGVVQARVSLLERRMRSSLCVGMRYKSRRAPVFPWISDTRSQAITSRIVRFDASRKFSARTNRGVRARLARVTTLATARVVGMARRPDGAAASAAVGNAYGRKLAGLCQVTRWDPQDGRLHP